MFSLKTHQAVSSKSHRCNNECNLVRARLSNGARRHGKHKGSTKEPIARVVEARHQSNSPAMNARASGLFGLSKNEVTDALSISRPR